MVIFSKEFSLNFMCNRLLILFYGWNYASSLKEFNLLWVYMQLVKSVYASYIPTINSNLSEQNNKNKKTERKGTWMSNLLFSESPHFQKQLVQLIIVESFCKWSLLNQKIWSFSSQRLGPTLRWIGLWVEDFSPLAGGFQNRLWVA